jgi:alpha-2-macroglobulin
MRFAALFFLILFNLPAALPQQSSYQLNLVNGWFPKENRDRYFQDAMECPGSIKGMIHVENEKGFTFFPHQELQAGKSYDCVFLPPFQNLQIQKIVILPIEIQRVERMAIEGVGTGLSIKFNAPVQANQLAELIKIYTKKNQSEHALSYQVFPQTPSHAFWLQIVDTFDSKSNLKVIYENQGQSTFQKGEREWLLDSHKKTQKTFSPDKKLAGLIFLDPPKVLTQPRGRFKIRLYLPERMSSKKNRSKIRIQPEIPFQLGASEYNYGRWSGKQKSSYMVDIFGEFPPDSEIRLEVLPGFQAKPLETKKSYSFSIKIPKREPYMLLENKLQYVSSLDAPLSFEWCNLPEVDAVLHKMPESHEPYFFQFGSPNMRRLLSLSPIHSQKSLKLSAPINEITKSSIKPHELGLTQLKNGIYAVRFFHKVKGKPVLLDEKILIPTELGIRAERDRDSLRVWIHDLVSLKSIQQAEVSVFDIFHQPLAAKSTDAKGSVSIPWKAERPPGFVLVDSNSKKSFLSLHSQYLKNTPRMSGNFFRVQGFLERKLFRPGEDVPWLFHIRNHEFEPLKSMPVKVRLVDPKGKTLQSLNEKTSELGAFKVTFQSATDWKTGPYRIYARYGGVERLISRFSLETFLPPRIQVQAELAHSVIGDEAILEVHGNARFLFGAPASDMPVLIQVEARETPGGHSKSPGFTMGMKPGSPSPINHSLATIKTWTGKNGEFSLKVPLKKKNLPAKMKGQVEVQILDEGREVNHYLGFEYYPGGRFVGIRPLFDGYPGTGKPYQFQVQFLQIPEGTELRIPYSVEVFRKIWKWSFDQSKNQSRYKEELVPIKSLAGLKEDRFEYQFESSGNYVLLVTDLTTSSLGSYSTYVGGSGDQYLRPSGSLKKVQILADETNVSPGETLSVQINSPVTGILHYTLGDHRIYESRSIPLSARTTSLKVTIPTTIGLNVDHLNLRVQTIRSLSGVSPLRFPINASGSITFFFQHPQRRQEISISNDAPLRSRGVQSVKIMGPLREGTEVYASIVDRGIHDLVRDRFKPFEDGLRAPIPNSIYHYDFLDKLDDPTLEYPMLRFGGDGSAEKARQKNLPPDSLNERVKPQAHFLGPLEPGEDGNVILSFDPRGFQGEVEVRVVALHSRSASSVSKGFSIRDEATLSASWPRYLFKGDRVLIPVQATTPRNWDSGLSLHSTSTENLQISELPSILFEKDRQREDFLIEAKALSPGSGEIVLELKNEKGQITSTSLNLPIQNSHVQSEYTEQGQTGTKWAPILPAGYASLEDKTLLIELDSNPYQVLKAHIKDLVNYPYGCAEQVSSRILALHSLQKLQGVLKEWTPLEIETLLQGGVIRLEKHFQDNKGFQFFPGGSVYPGLSLYVSEVLIQLQDDPLAQKLLKLSNPILLKILEKKKEKTLHRFHAAYLLAKRDRLRIEQWESLLETEKHQNDRLIQALKASTLTLLDQTQEARKIWRAIRTYSLKGENTWFSSRLRDETWIDYLGLKYGDFPKDVIRKQALKRLRQHRYLSTQEKAHLIRILVEAQPATKPGPFQGKLNFPGRTPVELSGTYKESIHLDSSINPLLELRVKSGLANYALSVLGQGPEPIFQRSKKLNLKQILKGGNLKNLRVGEELIFRQKILARDLENLVLNVRLPACIEAINPRLKGQQLYKSGLKLEYADFRDDRVLLFMHVKSEGILDLPVQVIQAGECQVPWSSVQAMYEPVLQDYFRLKPMLRVQR